jgi:hypothetical protein
MSRISFGDIWDRTRAFAAKEFSLLAPVALACFTIPAILWSMVEPEILDPTKPPAPGAWMFFPIPLLIVQLIGVLTLASLALTPGISVKEALHRAVRRLPVALGVLLVALGAGLLLAIALGTVIGVLKAAGTAGNVIVAFTVVLFYAIVLIIGTRLLLLWPIVAEGSDGPIQSLRRALRLTRGEFWRLFGLLLLGLIVTVVLAVTATLAGGSVMLILGHMIGDEALGRILAMVLAAIVVGLWQMVTVVYLTFLYRAYASDGKMSWGKGA